MSPNLSKQQLLNFLQCPRRFWLDQYHPEHEGDTEDMDAFLDADEAAVAIAHAQTTGDNVHAINSRLGLRHAIEQTAEQLSPGAILLSATFEYEGISVQADILDWAGDSRRALIFTGAEEVSRQHIEHCAVLAWAMHGLQMPQHQFLIGNLTDRDGSNQHSRFELTDVSNRIQTELDELDALVAQARQVHAALEEPAAAPGPHCRKPGYPCPFLDYCEQG